MKLVSNSYKSALVGVVLALVFGCSDKDKPTGPTPLPGDQAVPDFTLQDANTNSASHGQTISPRQQLGHISAWYFGHSS